MSADTLLNQVDPPLIPSQFAYVDGFSQVVEPFPPHFTFGFALYLPSSPPQHAFTTLPVKPITQKKRKIYQTYYAYQISVFIITRGWSALRAGEFIIKLFIF